MLIAKIQVLHTRHVKTAEPQETMSPGDGNNLDMNRLSKPAIPEAVCHYLHGTLFETCHQFPRRIIVACQSKRLCEAVVCLPRGFLRALMDIRRLVFKGPIHLEATAASEVHL